MAAHFKSNHIISSHFKDKLLQSLQDKKAPFRCPMKQCTYSSPDKNQWALHYGKTHNIIGKLVAQHLATKNSKRSVETPEVDIEPKIKRIRDDKYENISDSLDLPKATEILSSKFGIRKPTLLTNEIRKNDEPIRAPKALKEVNKEKLGNQR